MLTAVFGLLCLLGPDGTEADRAADAAKTALEQAGATRRQSFGTKGEEKLDILKRAAGEYEQVATQYADHAAVSAEAWFRAGEIHRTLRQVEQATRCFDQALRYEDVPSFPARALMELGHLKRRLKEYEAALQTYASVAERFPAERLQGVRAQTWQGKVLITLKRVEEGHALLLAVQGDYPEFPVEHIRNVDTVALSLIDAGEEEQARALVEECWKLHTTPAEGADEIDADVQKALDRMRAREKLEEQEVDRG